MKTMYLVTHGAYTQRMIGSAFQERSEAEQYIEWAKGYQPRHMGPWLPVEIVEITVYEHASEAIMEDMP